MKIASVTLNRRSRAFLVRLGRTIHPFPFARCRPSPSSRDPVASVQVDPELASEGFTYVLRSGAEGSVVAEQVLDYNRDPSYLRDLLVYQLTLEAKKRIERSGLSRREIIRRLGTSATQFYRLIDPANTTKTVDQMLCLLSVLDCDVRFVVRARSGPSSPRATSS